MSVSFTTCIDRLRTGLAGDLPGHEAHETMAPRYRARRSAMSIEDRPCREAGVLALLYPSPGPDDGEPVLVLTRRRDELPDHGGQISFPGGQRTDGEVLQETALREAREEIDLYPEPVTLIGALTPLYIPPSNFCVHPFAGVVSDPPSLRPTDDEVGAILHVSVPTLLHPDTRVVETWTLHGTEIDVPFYRVDEHVVWGATAMMLAELLAVVQNAETALR